MEETLGQKYILRLEDESFPLSTDSVLLASFVRPAGKMADLGSGCGTLGLLLCAKSETLRVQGIELDEAAHLRALENIRANHLEQRLFSCHGDVREIRKHFAAGSFDGVVSNPPYFPVGSGKTSGKHGMARSEERLNLRQLCEAAAWLLPTGGRFSLVHLPSRLCDVLCELRRAGLEPKRLQWVRHKPAFPCCLFFVEAVRGGKPDLRYEADFIEFDENGLPTEEYKAAYHIGGDK